MMNHDSTTERALRLPISQGVLFGWCIWLLLSWLMHLLTDRSAAGVGEYLFQRGDTVRWMLQSAAMGMLLIWPTYRLSQLRKVYCPTGIVVLCDVFSLVLLWQVVWMLGRLANWSVMQILLIDLTLMIWVLPVALLVWLGWRGERWRGAWAMGCIVVMISMGLWWSLLSGSMQYANYFTPFGMLWQASARELPAERGYAIARSLVAVAMVFLGVLLIVGLGVMLRSSRASQEVE